MTALSQQIRQVQRQVATPAMMMEMSLLTLPVGELREAVKKELSTNPALERDEPRYTRTVVPRDGGSSGNFAESVADERAETLDEHIMGELRMSGVSGRELEICRAIVAELDEDGRFKGEMPSMVMATGATEREIEAARRLVMSIDPKGCGARDLVECFAAQAEIVPAAEREAFVKDLANIPNLLPSTVAWMRKMDAFPGRQYDSRRTEYITPDITVDDDGEVYVDRRDIPELRVSRKYIEMAKDQSLDEETRTFAADRVKRAREFREALIRRMDTVEKIAELAVGGQGGFLEQGLAGLRRQTMGDVAARAHCDVSTVSRAAARKYVRTPRGTLPLRRFFVLVDQAPVEKLREMLLEAEATGEKPSDRELSERMSAAGFPMARRTVAKYRTKLGFPSNRLSIARSQGTAVKPKGK